MTLHHLLEDVPDLLVLPLVHLLGALDRVGVPKFFDAPDDEGQKKFSIQAARIEIVRRSVRSCHDDHATFEHF